MIKKFKTKFFDKIDDFSFYVNHMSYFISSKMVCSSVSSEILRISGITTNLINMVTRVNLFLYGLKSKVAIMFVSFHYWKRFLGNTWTYFKSLLMNSLSRLFITNLHICMFMDIFSKYLCIYVYVLCMIYVCVCIFCTAFLIAGDNSNSFAD